MIDIIPGLERPDDGDFLWRYMDLAQYIALLDSRALCFSNVSLLEDVYEGTYTRLHVPPDVALMATFRDIGLATVYSVHRSLDLNLARTNRRFTYVNCWHANDGESEAMRSLYNKSNNGIAIRTTFGRLKSSLASAPQLICVGTVKYLDYRQDTINSNEPLAPFLCKRQSVQHEREARLLHLDESAIARWYEENTAPPTIPDQNGISVGVDMETLVEDVFVSPRSPAWVEGLINSVTARYGLERRAQKSDLASGPLV